MAIEVFKRHEKKYLLNKDVYEIIQKKLMDYMEQDEHNTSQDFYTICNIYYDTKDNHLIRQSLSKPKYKEKLRLRSYGFPKEDEKVYLEIKKKYCGVVNKRRTTLRLNEAYEFVRTGIKPEAKEYMNRQVINEIEYMLRLYDLEPKVYLSYDRKALFCKEDRDLRVTFDTNIRARRDDLRLESGSYGESLLKRDLYLMEVKTIKSIPLWLSKLLSEYRVFGTSFSKYGEEHKRMVLKNKELEGDIDLCWKQYSIQQQLVPHFL